MKNKCPYKRKNQNKEQRNRDFHGESEKQMLQICRFIRMICKLRLKVGRIMFVNLRIKKKILLIRNDFTNNFSLVFLAVDKLRKNP